MTAWFANLSIRSRFVLPIAAMMLVFAAFITFFFPSSQRAGERGSAREQSAEHHPDGCLQRRGGLEFGDQVSVLQVFNWARTDEDLAYIVVRDTEGSRLRAIPPTVSTRSKIPGFREISSRRSRRTRSRS